MKKLSLNEMANVNGGGFSDCGYIAGTAIYGGLAGGLFGALLGLVFSYVYSAIADDGCI